MNTWILVADGSRANLFSRSSDQPHLHQVETWSNQGGRTPDHCSETDNLGSSRGGMGRQGSSMTPPTDPKRHSQQVFAKELISLLKTRHSGYDHLVVIAPPKFLGDLRAEFDHSIRHKLVGEFDKDFTHLSAHDLSPHLDKLLAQTHEEIAAVPARTAGTAASHPD